MTQNLKLTASASHGGGVPAHCRTVRSDGAGPGGVGPSRRRRALGSDSVKIVKPGYEPLWPSPYEPTSARGST
eukprot:751476-Hanusia_phi.AAC.6